MSKLPNPVANFRGLCAESFEYSTDFSEKDGSFVIHSTSRIVRQNIYRQTTFEYNHLTFKQNQHTHTLHTNTHTSYTFIEHFTRLNCHKKEITFIYIYPSLVYFFESVLGWLPHSPDGLIIGD